MAKTKDKHDIDDDPMFDTSAKAKSNAIDRQMVQILEAIENLREEKKEIADAEKDRFAQAKALGYEPKILRMMLTLRKMEPDDRAELDMKVETYRRNIGL